MIVTYNMQRFGCAGLAVWDVKCWLGHIAHVSGPVAAIGFRRQTSFTILTGAALELHYKLQYTTALQIYYQMCILYVLM